MRRSADKAAAVMCANQARAFSVRRTSWTLLLIPASTFPCALFPLFSLRVAPS